MSHSEKEIQIDYQARLRRVFQYIDAHLDTDLALSTLADMACFSPFHFHRIFKTISGETLGAYVNRRRIETAALALLHSSKPVSQIYQAHGFQDHSTFTRAFKKYYGVSPTRFKNQNPYKFSKIRQVKSNIGQAYPDFEQYLRFIEKLKRWITMNANIQIKQMPKLNVAYVPCMGPQNLSQAYQQLTRWASPKGLLGAQTKLLTVYYDSFKVTEPAKVRMDACIVLDQAAEAQGAIGLSAVPAGKCIVGSFEISLNEFEASWTGLFIWMNENGYEKADRNVFELYHNNFNTHPQKKAIVDFCIPIS